MARRPRRCATRIPFAIEYGGKSYEAMYYVEKAIVTVESEWGSKSAVIHGHGSNEDLLAKMMLREFLNLAKARGNV